MTPLLIAILQLALNQDVNASGDEIRLFIDDIGPMEERLLEELSDSATWTKGPSEASLRIYIEAARRLRAVSVAPALTAHLLYTPYSPNEKARLPYEIKYPAFGALIAIGTPAVPALIERLSLVHPEDGLHGGHEEHALIVRCLIDIYGPGGNGRQLAKLQVQLAADAATGLAKERLVRALERPILDSDFGKVPASD